MRTKRYWLFSYKEAYVDGEYIELTGMASFVGEYGTLEEAYERAELCDGEYHIQEVVNSQPTKRYNWEQARDATRESWPERLR
jgi:hypothetical protein